MLTVLTATGSRPDAFALCKRWMARQTYAGAVRWIVVDDGEIPQQIDQDFREGWTISHIRREPYWRQGQNTQAANLLCGLECVDRDDSLIVVEDDDWYAVDWLEHAEAQLCHASLVGEKRSRYYNVNTRRWKQFNNEYHASLCATAMRGDAINALRKSCELRKTFIDMRLWRAWSDKRLFDGHRVVGIKGMPGRAGIGVGHKENALRGECDPRGDLLREWVGADAETYIGMANG